MKLNSIAKKIAYTAMLTALALLMNVYAVPNTIVGTISFVYVPCFLAGILLGPVIGFTVGITADLLGCVIAPKGPISGLVLLSSGCLGLIAGLTFRLIRGEKIAVKMAVVYAAALIVCTLGLASVGNYVVTGYLQNKYITFWDYLLIVRLPKQPFILLINCGLTYGLVKIMARQTAFRKMIVRV